MMFKWAYQQFSTDKRNYHYSQVNISEELHNNVNAYFRSVKCVSNTTYILDDMIIYNLIREVKFFHSIFLITDEEKTLIKRDLYNLLKYMLEIANTGRFPGTDKKVNLYISSLSINTNYCYFYDGKASKCCLQIFNLYDIVSENQQIVNIFEKWIQARKKTAVKISEADEKRKIEFFEWQHKLIDAL